MRAGLTPSRVGGVGVQMRNQIPEGLRVWPHRIEPCPCSRKLVIAGELADTALEGEDLIDRDDEHKRAAVQPLPRVPVGARSPTRPGRLVSVKFVLNGARPDG